jgi:5-methylcytosine-specific restriction endonuclease McrA
MASPLDQLVRLEFIFIVAILVCGISFYFIILPKRRKIKQEYRLAKAKYIEEEQAARIELHKEKIANKARIRNSRRARIKQKLLPSLKKNSKHFKTTLDATSAKTKPAPENLKNTLYFERAMQHCEWCNEWVDTPEIHHIIPRSEGGPNLAKNLIVLCPNCHKKADLGIISRSKLEYKLDRQMQNWG